MNTSFKKYLKIVPFLTFPWFMSAQEMEGTAPSHHHGHSYDSSDWRRNVTLSLGVDAIRSNAEFSGDSNNASLSADPKWGYGAMASIELGLADYAGIALGAHYMQRRFQISGGAIDWTRTIQTITVPLEARFYLLRVLSVGAGGFAAFPVGKTKDSFDNGDSTLVNTGSKRKGVDYGLTGALGVNVPLGPVGIFGEARYNYGLTDSAANSDVEEKIRDLLFTVGVKVKI